MRGVLAVAAVVLLAGCRLSEPVTAPDLLIACGPRPYDEQVDQAVAYFVANVGFKDPGSVQVRGTAVDGPTRWNNAHGSKLGWQVSFQTNARNSFGGYGGFKPRHILLTPGGGCFWMYQTD